MPKKAYESVKEQPKFKLSVLRENAIKLFAVTTSTFDGATYGMDVNKDYTVDEIKKIITNWKKKEVK